MSIIGDLGGSNSIPTFNDPKYFTCWIDGEVFSDPGVYQQHMMMFHAQAVDVTAADRSIIESPAAPVISQPIGIVAPGVTLQPAGDQPYTYTPVFTPALQPFTPTYTPAPLMPGVSYNPTTGQAGQGSGRSTGWNELIGIGAILALGFGLAKSRRKRARR